MCDDDSVKAKSVTAFKADVVGKFSFAIQIAVLFINSLPF